MPTHCLSVQLELYIHKQHTGTTVITCKFSVMPMYKTAVQSGSTSVIWFTQACWQVVRQLQLHSQLAESVYTMCLHAFNYLSSSNIFTADSSRPCCSVECWESSAVVDHAHEHINILEYRWSLLGVHRSREPGCNKCGVNSSDIQPVYTTALDRAGSNQFNSCASVNMTGTDVNPTVPLWLWPPNTTEPAWPRPISLLV